MKEFSKNVGLDTERKGSVTNENHLSPTPLALRYSRSHTPAWKCILDLRMGYHAGAWEPVLWYFNYCQIPYRLSHQTDWCF